MDNNPEFVAQYSSEDEALTMLAKYSASHNFRYKKFTNVKIPMNSSGGTTTYLDVPELTGEKLLEAEQSLINHIPTAEGNARMQTITNQVFAGDKDFNQYQFSPEEVLAQRNGHQFFIDK